MAFTEDERKTILAAIQAKMPHMGKCSLCGHPLWSLGDGYVLLPLQTGISGMTIGGPVLPCVAVICANCGNTALLNVFVLGLKEMVEKESGLRLY